MTESQKIRSLLLDLLGVSCTVPRTLEWLQTEVRLAGYRYPDLRSELDTLESAGLAESAVDGLGVRRWAITTKGAESLLP